MSFLRQEKTRLTNRVQGQVVADRSRCVQYGICSFNCPVDIDVRGNAWTGEPVIHSRCLTCGECVRRCPRGTLKFERTNLFTEAPK